MQDCLASYIGFTEDEVKALCETYKKDFTEVKRWYDGYQLGKYHVYNPNAVVNYDGRMETSKVIGQEQLLMIRLFH